MSPHLRGAGQTYVPAITDLAHTAALSSRHGAPPEKRTHPRPVASKAQLPKGIGRRTAQDLTRVTGSSIFHTRHIHMPSRH